MHIIRNSIVVIFFTIILIATIAYARGYRLDVQKGTMTSTGIIAVSSNPQTAQVYVNGVLKGVTDLHLTLPFGKYSIEVKKEGYTSWKHDVVLKGELVVTADATLFPLNASLTPLSTIGISQVVSIDNTDKTLLFVENGDIEKDGIYVFDQAKRTFSLFPPLKLLVSKKLFPEDIHLKGVSVIFSPDFKQGITVFKRGEDTISYLISLEDESTQLYEITSSQPSLEKVWNEERDLETARLLEIYPKQFAKIASDSFHIISLAPDKSKILYSAKQQITLPYVIEPRLVAANQTPEERSIKLDELYVYDRKEDRNYHISLAEASQKMHDAGDVVLNWFPDSRHLVEHEGDKISIVEYDNTSKQIVYSGPHEGSFFDVTSDGKLLILANFNPQFNKTPDIYAVGIR
ncbi:MAG: PEGA domain-containing protein [Candidatus Roizmanbacteria bacterium]|nr:PEGA domain-containing protein [Candidatus Roizmanbacteria bacterium]